MPTISTGFQNAVESSTSESASLLLSRVKRLPLTTLYERWAVMCLMAVGSTVWLKESASPETSC